MVGVKSAEGKSARPGADEPVIRGRRRQESPILRGERDISRKAIAQGMSDCLRCPVCSCAFSSTLCTRDRGCSAHPAFPAPSCWRDNETHTSGASRRENADVYLVFEIELQLPQRHCEEPLRRSNPSYHRLRCEMDCFASLAMTADGGIPTYACARILSNVPASHGARPFASVDRMNAGLHSSGNQAKPNAIGRAPGGNIR